MPKVKLHLIPAAAKVATTLGIDPGDAGTETGIAKTGVPRLNEDGISVKGCQFIYAPNLDIVPQANKAYLDMMNLETEPGMKVNISVAHKNFLKWATYYLYVYGRKSDAAHWWTVMHELYPNVTPAGQDLEQYALERAQETVGETSHDDAKAVIDALCGEAFDDVIGDADRLHHF